MTALATEPHDYADLAGGAVSYAWRLASYLNDANYIRAMTLREFGDAPPLSGIQGAIDKRKHRNNRDTVGTPLEFERFDPRIFDRCSHGKRKDIDRSEGLKLATAITPTPHPKLPPPRDAKAMIALVAAEFDLHPCQVTGSSRKAICVAARAVVVRLLRERAPEIYSLGRLATIIGRRDHSVTKHLLATWDKRAAEFPQMKKAYRLLKGGEA